MEAFLFVITVLALIGAILNSYDHWQGFAIWIVTNTTFAFHNYTIGQWQQGLLFSVYILISINGLINKRKNHGKQKFNSDGTKDIPKDVAKSANDVATAPTQSASG